MKISLASPVYNESEKIQEFIEKSVKALSSISNEIEIILVNDCSTDDTLDKIKEILPFYPCVKLINLTQNSGQFITTSIALKHSTGDYIFMMDSDLQINPEYMVEFMNFSIKNPYYDVISSLRGTRSKKKIRRIGSKLISILLRKIAKNKLKDIGSSFKLIKRNALDKVLSHDILVQNYPILMMNLNLKIIELPIEYNNDQVRESHYKFSDLVFAIILALLNFSTGASTLIFLVFLGIILTIGGILCFGSVVLWGMINNSELPQNMVLFSLVLIIIGLQFLLLGMVVFKLERINKNLDFRKSINQRIEYEN